jgi:hypothetical protein
MTRQVILDLDLKDRPNPTLKTAIKTARLLAKEWPPLTETQGILAVSAGCA